MYKIFEQNLNNYYKVNECGNPDEYRLRIAQVLRGLADKNLYDKWKKERPDLYEEVNNLVYEIQQNQSRFHPFEAFSYDLWGLEYNAVRSDKFSKEEIEEQLKLINLLLGTQYWF
jgi:hypothetical protein